VLITPEPECCQLGQKCLFACGVNPNFHHHSLISHHTLTWFVSFLYDIIIKNIIARKTGQNRAVVGQVPHCPFPLKNQQKGCQKGWKTKFHQIPDHKRSTPVVFWGEKRPWVECDGSIRKHSVPEFANFELDFCPDHWGSPFGLKLHKTSSYLVTDMLFKRLHRKRNNFRTFTPSTTSA